MNQQHHILTAPNNKRRSQHRSILQHLVQNSTSGHPAAVAAENKTETTTIADIDRPWLFAYKLAESLFWPDVFSSSEYKSLPLGFLGLMEPINGFTEEQRLAIERKKAELYGQP